MNGSGMQYNRLGRSDLKISEVSFGCMSLGDNQEQSAALVRQAYDLGINFFDTADLYQKGRNEETVGKALSGIRSNVILATKVGNQWRPDGSGWDWNPTKRYILSAVEASLTRLQTDYIDLYQLHGGTIQDPIDETIEAFETLQQQGKIRHYGISSIRPNVIREYVKRSRIVSVMMQYSLLDRRPEEECLPLLQEHEIGVLARGSLAGGLLITKTSVNYLGYTPEDVGKMKAAVQKISGQMRSPAATALHFVLHPPVASAVVGIRTREQLQESITSIKTPPLSPEELLELRKTVDSNCYQDHR